jgi:hypothetical protein
MSDMGFSPWVRRAGFAAAVPAEKIEQEGGKAGRKPPKTLPAFL